MNKKLLSLAILSSSVFATQLTQLQGFFGENHLRGIDFAYQNYQEENWGIVSGANMNWGRAKKDNIEATQITFSGNIGLGMGAYMGFGTLRVNALAGLNLAGAKYDNLNDNGSMHGRIGYKIGSSILADINTNILIGLDLFYQEYFKNLDLQKAHGVESTLKAAYVFDNGMYVGLSYSYSNDYLSFGGANRFYIGLGYKSF